MSTLATKTDTRAATEETDTPIAPHISPSPKHNMHHTTSAPQDMSPSTEDPDGPISRLLDLPPEIRTMIWEFALISPTHVKVTDQLKQPALIQLNRQIRSETRKLAFLNNNYRIDIVACDARLFAKFFQLWQHVVNSNSNNKTSLTKKFVLPIRIKLVGDCHWLNLVRWCRLVAKGKCGALTIGPAARGMSKIVEAATGLAASTDSWEELERGLKFWRPVAALDDPQWLLDLEVAK